MVNREMHARPIASANQRMFGRQSVPARTGGRLAGTSTGILSGKQSAFTDQQHMDEECNNFKGESLDNRDRRLHSEERQYEYLSQNSNLSGKTSVETRSTLSSSIANKTRMIDGAMLDDAVREANGDLIAACEVMSVTKGRERDIERNRIASTKSKVEKFTKTMMFKGIKFIADQEELGSLRGKGTIGNIVMDYMNIDDQSKRYSWWMIYQEVVKRALDQQRSNCNIAVKDVVVGEYGMTMYVANTSLTLLDCFEYLQMQ
jgi:hypothetical protein